MGTRSDIIVHRADGKWHRIYCHWDGYLSHNGQILFEHYTSQALAEKLVQLGDLSSLGPSIGKKHPFELPRSDSPEYAKARERHYAMCTAYGRDRGEKDVAGTVGDTIQAAWPECDTWTEFTYVWDDGCWWVGDPDEGTQTLVNLGDALMGKEKVTPRVKAFGAVIGQHQKHDPKQPDSHKWNSVR